LSYLRARDAIHRQGLRMRMSPQDASIGDVVPDEVNDTRQLLKDRLATISDVRGIESSLLWDQQNNIGGQYDPDELIERVTGRTLDPAPYLRGKLYGL